MRPLALIGLGGDHDTVTELEVTLTLISSGGPLGATCIYMYDACNE